MFIPMFQCEMIQHVSHLISSHFLTTPRLNDIGAFHPVKHATQNSMRCFLVVKRRLASRLQESDSFWSSSESVHLQIPRLHVSPRVWGRVQAVMAALTRLFQLIQTNRQTQSLRDRQKHWISSFITASKMIAVYPVVHDTKTKTS